MRGCRYCGGDPRDPDHRVRCDGRQGHIEAQLPLFVSGLTPETWATSEAAAVSVEPTRETQREHVRTYIRSTGVTGAIDEEQQVALKLNGSSQRPRRVELEKFGLICQQRTETGSVLCRLTRRGRRAVVWVTPEFLRPVKA